MEDEKARNHWLGNQLWLRIFGGGARVKRREFVVLAHGIRCKGLMPEACNPDALRV
jgi:hypothetical protein